MIMKLRGFIFTAVAAVMAFAACEKKQENLGTPSITISASAMEFEIAGGDQQLTLNATRDWQVTGVPAWLAVTPGKGEASASDQTVVITALANNGGNRSADLKFSIGTFSKILKVSQKGEGGNVMPPVEEGMTSIADVLASTSALPSGTVIQGVVISNMALNNLTSKKGMYVQDATGGVQFYLAANHTFAYGTMVKIDLSGVTLGEYAGAKQISGLALDKITTVSTGNTVEAKPVTMADFLANKYEGQYVALEGVQAKAADLSKTWVVGDAHTSINFEDANGNSFIVFSSKYSTYGATTVAQGSGTIKGISSINNGNMQIIFTQESDYAGLTGARFEGTEVTPPAGGDDNTGDNTGDTPTPPTGDGTYEPGVTWTLGSKAYDKTSEGSGYDNSQRGTVNGETVSNILKLGSSSAVGDATINIPTGTKKLGFYCVAWKGKSNSPVKFSANGTEITTITPKANDGATGNPPYTLTLTDADYYTVDVPAGATAVKVETTVASQARVLFIGLKALTE